MSQVTRPISDKLNGFEVGTEKKLLMLIEYVNMLVEFNWLLCDAILS